MPSWYEMSYLMSETNAYAINMFEILVGLAGAYMIVAYNVGAKLTRLQVCLLNTVYLLVSGLVSWSYLGWRFITGKMGLEIQHLQESQGLAFQHLPNLTYSMYPVPQMVMAALISLAILLLSLVFMWSIRHGGKHIAAPHSLEENASH